MFFGPTQLRPSPPSLLDHEMRAIYTVWTNLAMPVTSGILCADLTDHCPTFLLVRNLSIDLKKWKITINLLCICPSWIGVVSSLVICAIGSSLSLVN